MSIFLTLTVPCQCLVGKLSFACEKEGLDANTVSYNISGTATCDICGRQEFIAPEMGVLACVLSEGDLTKVKQ